MSTATKVVLATLAATLTSVAAVFLVPTPEMSDYTPLAFHSVVAEVFVLTLLYAGAATLFIMGTLAYKARLRTAYLLITIGIFSKVVGLAQFPVIKSFGLEETAWVTNGILVLPFAVTGIAMYSGVRRIAKLVGIDGIWTKFWFVFPAGLLLGLATVPLPHTDIAFAEAGLDFINALSTFNMTLLGAAALIMFRLRSTMGEHYIIAMSWLFFALVGGVMETSTSVPLALAGNQDSHSLLYYFLIIIIGSIYLKAGREFALTKEV